METHTELEDRGDPSVGVNASLGGLRGPGDELQQRALAGTVVADDPHRLRRAERQG